MEAHGERIVRNGFALRRHGSGGQPNAPSRSALLQAPDGKKRTPRHMMDEPQQHDMSYNQAIVGAWERPRQAPMGL